MHRGLVDLVGVSHGVTAGTELVGAREVIELQQEEHEHDAANAAHHQRKQHMARNEQRRLKLDHSATARGTVTATGSGADASP